MASPPLDTYRVFVEALNSVLGLLLIVASLQLKRTFNNSFFGRGVKFLLVVAVFMAVREIGFFAELVFGAGIVRDLLTTLTFLAIVYGVYSIREEWRRVFEKLGGLAV